MVTNLGMKNTIAHETKNSKVRQAQVICIQMHRLVVHSSIQGWCKVAKQDPVSLL